MTDLHTGPTWHAISTAVRSLLLVARFAPGLDARTVGGRSVSFVAPFLYRELLGLPGLYKMDRDATEDRLIVALDADRIDFEGQEPARRQVRRWLARLS